MKFKTFHGTSPEMAQNILDTSISVTMGSGELGQGFYTGGRLHEALAWSLQMHGARKNNILELEHITEDFYSLDIKILDYMQAFNTRKHIKSIGETKIYHFNVDVVWSPIVGSERASGDQYKWESDKASILLNSPSKTSKRIR